jgi:hypothetical protein
LVLARCEFLYFQTFCVLSKIIFCPCE